MRCETHGAWHADGTFCPLCISQMNGNPPDKENPQAPAPLGDLPRAPVTPQSTLQTGAPEGFGDNDKPEAPKAVGSKKKIGPEDTVWFGKHKGVKAKYVDPTYWVWAAENLAWLEISPELREAGAKAKEAAKEASMVSDVIGPGTVLWFGKHKGRAADMCPPDYIVWLAENTNREIDDDFLEDCRVEVEAGNR